MSLKILSVAVRTPSIADGFAENREKSITALSEVLEAGYRQGEFQPMADFGATTHVLLEQIEGLALRSVLAQSSPNETEKQVLRQIVSRAILVRHQNS